MALTGWAVESHCPGLNPSSAAYGLWSWANSFKSLTLSFRMEISATLLGCPVDLCSQTHPSDHTMIQADQHF